MNKITALVLFSLSILLSGNLIAKEQDIWTIVGNDIWDYTIHDYISNLTPSDVENILSQKEKNEDLPNFKGEFLLRLVRSNENKKIVQILLDSQIDIKHSIMGRDALMLASGNNKNLNIIKILLEAGIDINSKDNSGKTSLMHALGNKNLKVARYLIEAGADVNVKDKYGNLLIDYFVQAKTDAPDIVKLMIDNGLDVNAEDKKCRRALDWTVSCGLPKTAEVLKKAGAKHNESLIGAPCYALKNSRFSFCNLD